jgi:phosphopantetheinyl transferase (holo-ACP synthase)
MARRWAVKEATFKAFQRYRVLFPEICTVRQRSAPRSSELLEDKLRVQIQTALPVADEVHALALQFHGETANLASQLRLEVRSSSGCRIG